jgi:two-component system OmpR family sensor kinase
MNNSLQYRLSIWLTALIIAAGILAGGISFSLAYNEAQEFQDDMLRKIATLVDADRLPPVGQQHLPGTLDDDNEANILVQRLSSSPEMHGGLDLPADLGGGLHTVVSGGSKWRVYVRSGEKIAVIQAIGIRSEAARDSAFRTVLPLLGLIPLLVFISRRLVRASLQPVRDLAHVADAQPEDRPGALPDVYVPEEIAPFVLSINRLLGRVNRLVAQQRRFVADAAHELRTPLTALSLQAQNLGRADSLELMRERVAPLQAGIERARHLTEQLLNLARTQAGTEPDQEVDVSTVARELIAEYLPLAEGKHIDLGLEELASLSVRTSPEALRLILRNGLENALKYSPENGEVTLRLLREGADPVIEIVDNGPGIPATEMERVFDPFYRAVEAGGEGSGLGLAIAREATARLGGSLSLTSRTDGPGLVFRYRHLREGGQKLAVAHTDSGQGHARPNHLPEESS